jgi:hypothetical protein
MRKWIVGAALAVGVVGGAIAINFGRYPCAECTLPSISGPEEQYVIRTLVNQDVSSWVDSNNEPNSVTLCNTSKCANYRYIPLSGMFQRTGNPWSCGSIAQCLPY